MPRKKNEVSDVQSVEKNGRQTKESEDEICLTAVDVLTVKELRDELAKCGIETSGRKPDLVSKLKATLSEQKPRDHKSIGSTEDVGYGSYRVKKCQDASKSSNIVVGEKRKEIASDNGIDSKSETCKKQRTLDIRNMSVNDIRSELSLHGLSTSGTKNVLVQRLEAAIQNSSLLKSESVVGDGNDGSVKERKIVTATKKGDAVLDTWLPDYIKSCYHVLNIGGTVYDAMLNQTNVGENNNKFYVIQALEADTGGKFMVYNRWGRVGVKGQDKLFGPFVSIHDATYEFETKFYDKTKNHWRERHKFMPYPKKYTWLEMDYSENTSDGNKHADADRTSLVGKNVARQSKLDNRVAQLISLICNEGMMKQQMMEIGYNANKLPLGKLSKSTILKGYDVLKRLSVALAQADKKYLEQLSSEFYTVIPHDFGFRKMREFIIDTPQKLKRKLEMVEALGEIELATKLLKTDTGEEEDPLFAHYLNLHCQIFPLDSDSEEVDLIKRYVANTHAKTHSNYTLGVLQIFKIARDHEDDRFQKFSATNNRMLLWHGSRLTNWMGILSQGLRIAPPEAPVTGYMFGKGVYFADMVSKSANYCYATMSSPIGLLLLCEVALGDMAELTEADYNADKLPAGKQSTKGVGRTTPNPDESYTLPNGVIVPLGKPKEQTGCQGALLYNEFIVYNVEQIRMKYLVQVKFNFRKRK